MQFPFVRQLAIGSGLVLLTLLAYSGIWRNGFVHFDDPGYVTNNARVLEGLTWRGWVYAWTTGDTGNWIPLTWLSLQLDATLCGVDARGYHATNLILHIVNGILVWIAFGRLTGNWMRSASVAALFLVHPMHVESVAWISERKDVLSTFWLLLTILAYVRYVQTPNLLRYAVVCLFFAAGLLSKSMLVTTPLLLLLIDVWPLRRAEKPVEGTLGTLPISWWRMCIEKVPLLLLSLADGLITIKTQVGINTVADDSGQSWRNRFATVVESYCWYLEKTVWPTNLIPFYQPPDEGFSGVRIAASFAVIFLISFVMIVSRRRTAIAFGWWWFLVSLLPVIGLIRVGAQAHADRYSYIPHIGLFVSIVWPLADYFANRPRLRNAGAIGLGVIVCVLSLQTHNQVARWESNESLWTYTLSVDPHNTMAHMQLGNDDREAGRLDAARTHYQAALIRWPESFQIHNYLSVVAATTGDLEEAERYSRRALVLNPASETASLNLGIMLSHQNRPSEATDVLLTFLKSDPNSIKARHILGILFEQQNQFKEAWEQFEWVLKINPDNTEALTHGAYNAARLNRPRDAQRLYARLLKAQPENIPVLLNSAILAEQAGERELAKSRYLAVIALQPDNTQAISRLRSLSSK